MICAVEGCERTDLHARGLCGLHYQRLRAHGDPTVLLRDTTPGPPEVRFWRFVDKNGPLPHPESMAAGKSPCWLWTSGDSGFGYGVFSDEHGRSVGAHRWSWAHVNGPIPEAHHVDHLCHNGDPTCSGGATCRHRRCVNPDHLDAVTHRENGMRSFRSPSTVNAAKTHCPRGHEYTPENTYRQPGGRVCKTCRHIREVAREARLKAGLAIDEFCVPDAIDFDGEWRRVEWPCGETWEGTEDVRVALREHLCPDPEAVCPEVEQQPQGGLRLLPGCRERSVGTAPVRQSDHRPEVAASGGTSRPHRLTGEATQ